MTDGCGCAGKFPHDVYGLAHLAASGHLPDCEAGWLSTDEVVGALLTRVAVAESARDFYHEACIQTSHEVEQVLGAALGYPLLYPEASDADDGTVCVGPNTAASLADEAADRVRMLDGLVRRHYGPVEFGAGMWTTKTADGFDRLHENLDEAQRAAWAAATGERGPT